MVERIILTVIAYVLISVVCGWIGYKCYQDSKEDLKDVFRCAWRAIKKKAD